MRPELRRGRGHESGLTLVEVLVALAVFALIGAAGLSMLDGILRAQASSEGRLETLARVQRAMHVVGTDLMQVEAGTVVASEAALSFRRAHRHAVSYALEERALVRHVARAGEPPARQVLLAETTSLSWRFFSPELGWVSAWPPVADRPREDVATPAPWRNPAAIELGIEIAGPSMAGTLRRIAVLPAEALP